MRNPTIALLAFVAGASFEAFLNPVSELLFKKWVKKFEQPAISVLAPLKKATVSQLDENGVVIASRPYPIDQLVYVVIRNNTPNTLRDVHISLRFNPDFGTIPFLSKAQIMTSSLRGSESAKVLMKDDGNFEIDVPTVPQNGVVFGQFAYWEPVSTIVEIHYGNEVFFDVVPAGCDKSCEGQTLVIPAALDSFFLYSEPECEKDGLLLDCPTPSLEGRGDVFSVNSGESLSLTWDIVFANERFSPLDPRITIGRQGRLYSETLSHE